MWDVIEQAIREATGSGFRAESQSPVHGGSINEAWHLRGPGGPFFVKLNEATRLPMFEAEAAGLEALQASGAIRVPRAVALGEADTRSFLVLEYIEFGAMTRATSEVLGHQLARMHRAGAERFGWERDNTIGSTPQPNPWKSSWAAFFAEHRLQFQLQLAAANGADAGLLDKGAKLKESLPVFLGDHAPAPSLLHGDLWSGNWDADSLGNPVLFDPAVYYGDREADLAMTELFGGFDRRFYAAYEEEWPLQPGYPLRRTLYNLYHVLNHFNLFGGGYQGQARSMVEALLSEAS